MRTDIGGERRSAPLHARAGPEASCSTRATPTSRRVGHGDAESAAAAAHCIAAIGCLGGYFPKDMKCLAIPLVKLSM